MVSQSLIPSPYFVLNSKLYETFWKPGYCLHDLKSFLAHYVLQVNTNSILYLFMSHWSPFALWTYPSFSQTLRHTCPECHFTPLFTSHPRTACTCPHPTSLHRAFMLTTSCATQGSARVSLNSERQVSCCRLWGVKWISLVLTLAFSKFIAPIPGKFHMGETMS